MNASVAICISQKFKFVPKFRLHSRGEGDCTLVLCLPSVGRAVAAREGCCQPTGHAGLLVGPLRDVAKKATQLGVWQGVVGVGWWLFPHRGQIFISAPCSSLWRKGRSSRTAELAPRGTTVGFLLGRGLERCYASKFFFILAASSNEICFL